MTPKERAQNLLDKYFVEVDGCDEHFDNMNSLCHHQAKQCAIICVEQIIPCTWKLSSYKKNGYTYVDEVTTTEYWKEVLEILKNS